MNIEQLKKDLIVDEGLRLKPYRCTAGKLTIGVGRNIEDNGIREDEAMYLLNNDISECLADCQKIFGDDWSKFSEPRQRAFCNMRFNLGAGTFRNFKTMIRFAKELNWTMAAYQMKNSKWYSQVGDRAKRLIKMVLNG